MTSDPPSLTDLRREIDRIDEALHDLLMQRTGVVEQVRGVKRQDAGGNWRPAREAEVLRRLLARHRGGLPRGTIVHIWRELMSALVGIQGPFAIAVFDGARGAGYWDLARDHFGAIAPMRRYETVRGVIHAVADGEATAGVLPLPEDGEGDPWWPSLGRAASGAPIRICARLPFAPGGNGQGADMGALVVGDVPFDRSGADRSYLLVESPAGVSRASFLAALSQVRLQPEFLATWQDGGHDAPTLYLVEVDDYVGEGDARLARLAEAERAVTGVRAIGGYATPLREAELGLAPRRPGAGR